MNLFLDLETGGYNSWKRPVLQIAGILEEDGEVVEEFDMKVRPHEDKTASEDALEFLDLTSDEIAQYPDPELVHKRLTDGILDQYVDRYDREDKLFLLGYNIQFDEDFLRQFFKDCGDQYFGSWFFAPAIDVMVLAGEYLRPQRPQMKNFKQGTVASQLGIGVDEDALHDALYDVTICREIYHIVTNSERAPIENE